VVQHIDYGALGVPVLFPDVGPAAFDAEWSRLPLQLRMQAKAATTLYGVGLRLFGSREAVARHAEVDDLPSPEYVAATADRHLGPLLQLLIDDRDAHLLGALERIHDERHNEAIEVAVVYGAGHMPAVVHYLDRRFRYWASDAEWLTVFER
jgi:pheromone shutdown protein TraB